MTCVWHQNYHFTTCFWHVWFQECNLATCVLHIWFQKGHFTIGVLTGRLENTQNISLLALGSGVGHLFLNLTGPMAISGADLSADYTLNCPMAISGTGAPWQLLRPGFFWRSSACIGPSSGLLVVVQWSLMPLIWSSPLLYHNIGSYLLPIVKNFFCCQGWWWVWFYI